MKRIYIVFAVIFAFAAMLMVLEVQEPVNASLDAHKCYMHDDFHRCFTATPKPTIKPTVKPTRTKTNTPAPTSVIAPGSNCFMIGTVSLNPNRYRWQCTDSKGVIYYVVLKSDGSNG